MYCAPEVIHMTRGQPFVSQDFDFELRPLVKDGFLQIYLYFDAILVLFPRVHFTSFYETFKSLKISSRHLDDPR